MNIPMTKKEYSLEFVLERPQEIYFAMNATRDILYRERLASAPLGHVEQTRINNFGIVKDEETRGRYFYIQFPIKKLPVRLNDTLDLRVRELSICSPNFSADETERMKQREEIHEILKAQGQWTLGCDFQLLKLKWY